MQRIGRRSTSFLRKISPGSRSIGSIARYSTRTPYRQGPSTALFRQRSMMFSSFPSHTVVPMPALSPTMESGSISTWLLKEGDAFSAGQAICEVETDKATVTYEATDDGYIAKILVGGGELQVGQPMMVTVEEASDVSAFSTFSLQDVGVGSPAAAPPAAAPVAPPAASGPVTHTPEPAASSPATTGGSSATGGGGDGRVVASPFARKLAREAGLDLSALTAHGLVSGPNGRILASDVTTALSKGITAALAPASTPSTSLVSAAPPSQTAPALAAAPPASSSVDTTGAANEVLASLFTHSKRVVPHYFLSVELDLTRLVRLREELGPEKVSVQDFLIKAAAKAMAKVPDVNAAWMDSFVRKYHEVHINVVMGHGAELRAPVLQNVDSLGLSAINSALSEITADESPFHTSPLSMGTFAIHNLGLFGVKSAAPIVLPPQACALALGAVVDSVVPNPLRGKDGEELWKIAPTMTTTLSCDHRTVDGAVGASWLAAFKEYVENPLTLLL